MEGIPEKIDSKFRFVLLAAHRAEQMMQGAPPKVQSESHKVTTLAIEEVLADKVDWDYGPPLVDDVKAAGAVEAESATEVAGEG